MKLDYFFWQIGLLLYGVTIDSTIVGSPAYNSRQLESGDTIIQVDGVAATPASSHPRPMQNISKADCQIMYCRQTLLIS
jgi:hypothetical protein